MSTNVSEIGQLIAQVRSLTSRAQAIIDLGLSPEAMMAIFQEVLDNGGSEVAQLIQQAVNEAIVAQQDVSGAVDNAITEAIEAGKITSVTQAQVEQVVASSAQEGGAVAGAMADRLLASLAETESEVDGEILVERGEVAEAIYQSMRAAIDGGSVETPGGAAERAKKVLEEARSIGGIQLSDFLTVNDRIDLGVID